MFLLVMPSQTEATNIYCWRAIIIVGPFLFRINYTHPFFSLFHLGEYWQSLDGKRQYLENHDTRWQSVHRLHHPML